MKTLVYWVGLILIGFSLWLLVIALWIYLTLFSSYKLSVFSGPAILIIGAIIFTVIGLRMMKEGRE